MISNQAWRRPQLDGPQADQDPHLWGCGICRSDGQGAHWTMRLGKPVPQYALWWTSGPLKLQVHRSQHPDAHRTIDMAPGSWLLFAIAENVTVQLPGAADRFWWIRFSTRLFRLRHQDHGPANILCSPAPGGRSAARLGAALRRLVATRVQQEGGIPAVQRLKTRAIFLKVLSRLLDQLAADFSDSVIIASGEPVAEASESKDIRSDMERALDMLHDRLDDPDLALEAVAQAVGYHPNYLSQKFKAVFGETPTVLLQRLRIAKAQELLGHSALPITEISAAVGYHPNYFYRLFRSATGVTPGQYREQHRGESLTSR